MISPRRWARWALVAAVTASLLPPQSLNAQKKKPGPRPTPNATGPEVAVTPDNTDLGVTPNTSGAAGFWAPRVVG